MSEFAPGPLRKIVRREGDIEYLECGHEQPKKHNAARRRRCRQCRQGTLTVKERQETEQGVRCPYCFDDFSNAEEPTQTCKKCRVRLHEECFEENGGCTTLGCRGRTVTVRPRPAPAPVAAQTAAREEDEEHGTEVDPLLVALFLMMVGGPLVTCLLTYWYIAVPVFVVTFIAFAVSSYYKQNRQ